MVKRLQIPNAKHGRVRWGAAKRFLRLNLLTLLTVSGVCLGVVVGYVLKASREPGGWDSRRISYVTFLGDVFLSMLNGLVVPLIVTSVIAAVASLDLRMSSKIARRAVWFFLLTTVLAVVLGIFLALAIQPGVRLVTTSSGEVRRQTLAPIKDKDKEPSLVQDTLMDVLRWMFPPNLVQAAFEHYKTKLTLPESARILNESRVMEKWPLEKYEMSESYERGTNLLGILTFSVATGIAVAKLGDKGLAVLRFFQSLSDAMTIVTGWVIRLSPIGVTSLIAGEMLKEHEAGDVAKTLGLYLLTVLIGHGIHGFLFLPLIYFFLTWKQPFSYVVNLAPAVFTAFGTGSSSATLPVTIKCVEDKNDVDPRIARFLLPIGATVNMDGTALFQAVAAVFIAQLIGIQLTIGKVVIITIMSVAASAAAAGIPQGGFITLVMVLSTLGIPGKFIAYVLPVDWLLDRSRTGINVLGDAIGAGVIHELSSKELYALPLDLPVPYTSAAASRSTVREEDLDGAHPSVTPPPSPTDNPARGTKVHVIQHTPVTTLY